MTNTHSYLDQILILLTDNGGGEDDEDLKQKHVLVSD